MGNVLGCPCHYIVHDFATSMARKDYRVFVVLYGTELDEWPEDDISK